MFCIEKKPSCFDEESDLFIEVECFNVDPVLGPAPDGLSEHQVLSYKYTPHIQYSFSFTLNKFPLYVVSMYKQVMRRCILEMILESEKNYLEGLKRVLEVFSLFSF